MTNAPQAGHTPGPKQVTGVPRADPFGLPRAQHLRRLRPLRRPWRPAPDSTALRPQPPAGAPDGRQTLITTGIEDAVAAARAAAGDKDVALMGGGVVTEALKARLLDELILHQVPVLLGAGRPYVRELPEHVRLHLVEVVPAPGVTHLRYEVER